MNEDIMRLKQQVKQSIEKFAMDYWIATGIKPGLNVSDFGGHIEVQFPETLPERTVSQEEE